MRHLHVRENTGVKTNYELRITNYELRNEILTVFRRVRDEIRDWIEKIFGKDAEQANGISVTDLFIPHLKKTTDL